MNKLHVERKIKNKIREMICLYMGQKIFQNKDYRITKYDIKPIANKITDFVAHYIDENYIEFYHYDYDNNRNNK